MTSTFIKLVSQVLYIKRRQCSLQRKPGFVSRHVDVVELNLLGTHESHVTNDIDNSDSILILVLLRSEQQFRQEARREDLVSEVICLPLSFESISRQRERCIHDLYFPKPVGQ